MTAGWRAGVAVTALAALAACERPVVLSGPRFDVRAGTDAIFADQPAEPAANRVEPIRLPAPVANADWAQRGGAPSRAMPHLALSPGAQPLWAVPIGTGNGRRTAITAAPVVAQGVAFAMDALAQVTAVGPGGAVLWRADAALPGEPPGTAAGGGLAVAGGRVYATTGFGEVVVLDAASGAPVWRKRLAAPVAGAPTVVDGTVFVAARDGAGHALDAADGKLLWSVSGVPQTVGRANAPAPAVAGDLVYFPSAAGEVLVADRRAGVALFAVQAAGPRPGRAAALLSDLTGDPVIAGDTGYAGSAAGRTVAFDARTGTPRWNVPHGAMGPVFPAGGAVFLVDDLGRLVRLDAGTGATVWAVPLGHFTSPEPRRQRDVVAHFGPLVAGGRVWVASSDGLIRVVDPADGRVERTLPIAGGAAAAPALAGGTLYVVSGEGRLHAFR